MKSYIFPHTHTHTTIQLALEEPVQFKPTIQLKTTSTVRSAIQYIYKFSIISIIVALFSFLSVCHASSSVLYKAFLVYLRLNNTVHFSLFFFFICCVCVCARTSLLLFFDDVTTRELDYFLLSCRIVQVGASHLFIDCVEIVSSCHTHTHRHHNRKLSLFIATRRNQNFLWYQNPIRFQSAYTATYEYQNCSIQFYVHLSRFH